MNKNEIFIGSKIGKLTLLKSIENNKWLCRCECGKYSTPATLNLNSRKIKSCGRCGENQYIDLVDESTTMVTCPNGDHFYIDKKDKDKIYMHTWYICVDEKGYKAVTTADRLNLARFLMKAPINLEVDHIDLDRTNNRRSNLRLCTHQQNQFNQPLQVNNTSGVTGVSYYAPRNKYRARIKVAQHDIHLGYYESFEEATQARNVGMRCMFGQYGRYNEVQEPPKWIESKVVEQCLKFSQLAPHSAFFDFWEVEHE